MSRRVFWVVAGLVVVVALIAVFSSDPQEEPEVLSSTPTQTLLRVAEPNSAVPQPLSQQLQGGGESQFNNKPQLQPSLGGGLQPNAKSSTFGKSPTN